jgi:hypothetical protein
VSDGSVRGETRVWGRAAGRRIGDVRPMCGDGGQDDGVGVHRETEKGDVGKEKHATWAADTVGV